MEAKYIRHTILDGNCTREDQPTDEQFEDLVDMTIEALKRGFPNAEVEVIMLRRTSGAAPPDVVEGYPDTDLAEVTVHELTQEAWMLWSQKHEVG